MANNTFTTTRIYEREWRDIIPSTRLFDHDFDRPLRHHHHRLFDDPFFKRTPFSGSLESLRTAGVNESGPSSDTRAEPKPSYSSTTYSHKTEERVYEDGKHRFVVVLDMSQYAPEEIKVKVSDDMLMIEADHDEKKDEHGFVCRSIRRRYPLPKDVDSQAFVSELTKDGMLTVKAPKIDMSKQPKERVVPVQINGKSTQRKS